MEIIGLAGYAKAGKSCIAEVVAKTLGAEVVSFAGLLKERCAGLFPSSTSKEDRREVYVAYGRAMRKIDPDYWVKKLWNRMLLGAVNMYVIDDVRYANEVAWIKSGGGVVIRIHRPGVVAANQEEVESFGQMPSLETVLNDETTLAASDRVMRAIFKHREMSSTTATDFAA